MATFYSSFFSAGLLAADPDQHTTSRPQTPDPTTPRPPTASLEDKTPTAPTHGLPPPQSSDDVLPSLATDNTQPEAERPRMRRRRSSLGLSASPVVPLKSNASGARASASAHIQRQSLTTTSMSNRSRSGSVTESGIFMSRAAMSVGNNDATKGNSLMGRLRSGSVGTALRPRRFRKQASVPLPLPPPPNVPLPAVPQFTDPQTPRRPLGRRTQTSDSIPLPIHTPIMPYPPSYDRGDAIPSSPLAAGTSRTRITALGDSMDVDVYDYPSPVDTPARLRVGGYF